MFEVTRYRENNTVSSPIIQALTDVDIIIKAT
jgi:hypothetical protein